MRTKIYQSTNGPVAVVPRDFNSNAVNKRLKRASAKVGERLIFVCGNVFRSVRANALMHHRLCFSQRSAAYNPSEFGPRSFFDWNSPKSKASKLANKWIAKKAKQLGHSQVPPARFFFNSGVPKSVMNLAYRLADGCCSMPGPCSKIP